MLLAKLNFIKSQMFRILQVKFIYAFSRSLGQHKIRD